MKAQYVTADELVEDVKMPKNLPNKINIEDNEF